MKKMLILIGPIELEMDGYQGRLNTKNLKGIKDTYASIWSVFFFYCFA
jgi:hypothetical protein